MEAIFEKTVEELQAFHKFSEEDFELLSRADKAAEELLVPEMEYYVQRKFNEKIPEILKNNGLMGVPVQEKYGGDGADALVHSLILQRLGQVGMGVVTFLDVQSSLCQLTIQQWGTEDQKETYLTPSAKGDVIMAYALTEPEAGSDPASLRTTYRSTGSGFVLNGSKYLISNGSIADAAIVFAYPEGKQTGMCAFLVDTESSGFNVAMRLEEKVGLFTSDTALIEISDCEVPKGNVLGGEGEGLHVAYSALLNGRIGVAAGCVGVIADCMNSVIERARTRVQHGKEIGKHQLVQKHIAAIAMNLEMAKWPANLVAIKKMELDKNPQNREVRTELDRYSAMAKKIASTLAFESADRAVQVFGGFGYSILSPIGRHFLDTRVARIYEGTDEIMDLKIASMILGKDFESFK